MDHNIREAQKRVLRVFSKEAKDFALAGGTALELYYLHHRFSSDLDFFSPKYSATEIDRLIGALREEIDKKIRLESELTAGGRAKVRFYTMPAKGAKRPLKIDFVEDVIFDKPSVRAIRGVRVYSAENIYLQKLFAIAGIRPVVDEVGRPIMEGRNEPRDVFDVYMLSKKIKPLHLFLQGISPQLQKGIIHWYRRFSRQDLKLALIDMEIYDKEFDSQKMVIYLEEEIQRFMEKVIEE